MTFRFYVCLLLLIGGIAIGGAFLRPPVRGSVVLSTAIPATARPMQIPDYSGQALRLSAGKISVPLIALRTDLRQRRSCQRRRKFTRRNFPLVVGRQRQHSSRPSKIRLAPPWPISIPGAA